jgi:hypothetical protein
MRGTFLFGGSDFVMLFQSKADFQLTAPKDPMGSYKPLLMGEEYVRIKTTKGSIHLLFGKDINRHFPVPDFRAK